MKPNEKEPIVFHFVFSQASNADYILCSLCVDNRWNILWWNKSLQPNRYVYVSVLSTSLWIHWRQNGVHSLTWKGNINLAEKRWRLSQYTASSILKCCINKAQTEWPGCLLDMWQAFSYNLKYQTVKNIIHICQKHFDTISAFSPSSSLSQAR